MNEFQLDDDFQLENQTPSDLSDSSPVNMHSYGDYLNIHPSKFIKKFDIMNACLVNGNYDVSDTNFELLTRNNLNEQYVEPAVKERHRLLSSPSLHVNTVVAYQKYMIGYYTYLQQIAISMQKEVVSKFFLNYTEYKDKMADSKAKLSYINKILAKATPADKEARPQHYSDLQVQANALENYFYTAQSNMVTSYLNYTKVDEFMKELVNLYKCLLVKAPDLPCLAECLVNMSATIIKDIKMDSFNNVMKATFNCECGHKFVEDYSKFGKINLDNKGITYTLENMVKRICEIFENVPVYCNITKLSIYETCFNNNAQLTTGYLACKTLNQKMDFISKNMNALNITPSKQNYIKYINMMQSSYTNRHYKLLSMLFINPSEQIPLSNGIVLSKTTVLELIKKHPMLKGTDSDVLNIYSATEFSRMTQEQLARIARANLGQLVSYKYTQALSAKSQLRIKYAYIVCPECKRVHIMPKPFLDTMNITFMHWQNNRNLSEGTFISFEDAMSCCRYPEKVAMPRIQQSSYVERQMANISMNAKCNSTKATNMNTTDVRVRDMKRATSAIKAIQMQYNLVNDVLAQRFYQAQQNNDQHACQAIMQENEQLRNTYMEQQGMKAPIKEEPVDPYTLPPEEFKIYMMSEYDKPLEDMTFEELTSKGFYSLKSLQYYYDNTQYDDILEFLNAVVRQDAMWEELPEVIQDKVMEEYPAQHATPEMMSDFFM